MKKPFLFLTFLLIIICCSQSGSVERNIGKTIDNCQQNTDCLIKITEFTEFEWDKMYVFDYGLSPEAIAEILAMPAPHYEEFKRWLVFIKNDKIVYREIEPTDIEGIVQGQIVFSNLNNNRYYLYTPETAIFKAKKLNDSQNKDYYSLTQLP